MNNTTPIQASVSVTVFIDGRDVNIEMAAEFEDFGDASAFIGQAYAILNKTTESE